MKKLLIILLILISCEINNDIELCGVVIEIGWNVKASPIIKVPIKDCLDYWDVRVLLYDDNDNSELIRWNVIKDTVILNASRIDLSKYQKNVQKCEIYLID
jgi:hypothetical protein